MNRLTKWTRAARQGQRITSLHTKTIIWASHVRQQTRSFRLTVITSTLTNRLTLFIMSSLANQSILTVFSLKRMFSKEWLWRAKITPHHYLVRKKGWVKAYFIRITCPSLTTPYQLLIIGRSSKNRVLVQETMNTKTLSAISISRTQWLQLSPNSVSRSSWLTDQLYKTIAILNLLTCILRIQ